MKRSFAEFYMQCDADERRKAVKELEERLANTKDVDCMVCQLDLKDYYGVCSELRGHTEVLQVSNTDRKLGRFQFSCIFQLNRLEQQPPTSI